MRKEESILLDVRGCRGFIALAVAVGITFLSIGCTARLSAPTSAVEQLSPSPVPLSTPSLQLPAISLPTPLSPTVDSLTSVLSPNAKLLVTVPISTPSGYVPGQQFFPLGWSPDGKTAAYSWGDGIWTIQEPEYQPVLLVRVPQGRMGGVKWSPDGQNLAFCGDQWQEKDELWGEFIWVVKADGTGLKNLGATSDPYRLKSINQWLDDHTLTFNLWVGSGAQDLFQVDIANGETKRLLGTQEHAQVQATGGNYYWSPTHEYIAIQDCCFGHIVVVHVGSLEDRKWLSNYSEPPYQKFQGWLANGHQFLYTQSEMGASPKTYDPTSSLWLWDVNHGEGHELLDHVFQAASSPDGSRVAFLRLENRPGRLSGGAKPDIPPEKQLSVVTLGVLELATGKTIFYGPAGYKAQETPEQPRYWEAGRPVWSPDGELLTYWGEEGDVWIISADGLWRQRLTPELEIVQVLWSPDGGTLALWSFDRAWVIERPQRLASGLCGEKRASQGDSFPQCAGLEGNW